METAFHNAVHVVKRNALCFLQAMLCYIMGTIDLDEDDTRRLSSSDDVTRISKSLSWLFRHSGLTHTDSSLTVGEVLTVTSLMKLLGAIYRDSNRSISFGDVASVRDPRILSENQDSVRFMLPLAFSIVHNTKGRYAVSVCENYTPGTLSNRPFCCFGTDADYRHIGQQMPRACEQVYIRAQSGHSQNIGASVEQEYDGRHPVLVHGTTFHAWKSIRGEGLVPGGQRGSQHRAHVHLLPLTMLYSAPEHLKPNTAVLIFVEGDFYVQSRRRTFETPNHYVLADSTIHPDRFMGAWDLEDHKWLKFIDEDKYSDEVLEHIDHHTQFLEAAISLVGVGEPLSSMERDDIDDYFSGSPVMRMIRGLASAVFGSNFSVSTAQEEEEQEEPIHETPEERAQVHRRVSLVERSLLESVSEVADAVSVTRTAIEAARSRHTRNRQEAAAREEARARRPPAERWLAGEAEADSSAADRRTLAEEVMSPMVLSDSLIRFVSTGGDRTFGHSPSEHSEYRKQAFMDLIDSVRNGETTGNSIIDNMLRIGISTIASAQDTYETGQYVPTVVEHLNQQNPLDPTSICRPSILFEATPRMPESSIKALVELARNCLSGNSARSNRIASQDYGQQTSTPYISILGLNLGDLNRYILLGGQHYLPQEKQTPEYRVLPSLVVNNSSHICVLMEADGVDGYSDLAKQHGRIGLVASKSQGLAPAIGCFLKTTDGFIELLSQTEFPARKGLWTLTFAVFRCVFGSNTSGRWNPVTYQYEDADSSARRTIQPFGDALAQTTDLASGGILWYEGQAASELDDDMHWRGRPVSRGSESDCKRLDLAEVRIIGFHINSKTWHSGYMQSVEYWRKLILVAIREMVDFIVGDGNLFVNRAFAKDTHGDHRTSIFIDTLEAILQHANTERSPSARITYSVSVSTQAATQVRMRALEIQPDIRDKDEEHGYDCLLVISLSYGKQSLMRESREADEYAKKAYFSGPVKSSELILKESERWKYLGPMDLLLGSSDQACHSPLQIRAVLQSQRNIRQRTLESQQHREQRAEAKRGSSSTAQASSWRYDSSWDDSSWNDHFGWYNSGTGWSGWNYSDWDYGYSDSYNWRDHWYGSSSSSSGWAESWRDEWR